MLFNSIEFLLFVPVVFLLYWFVMQKNLKRYFYLFTIVILPLSSFSQQPENNSIIIDDGAWCWFSDPRAIRYEGEFDKTYIGSVSSKGNGHPRSEPYNSIIYLSRPHNDVF